MVTASGIRIEPTSKFGEAYHRAPGITDMAQGQYRMCRYGGHTRQWWSVLQHALVCYDVASYLPRYGDVYEMKYYNAASYLPRYGDDVYEMKYAVSRDPAVWLEALWHDAHEAVTADVPMHWKPKELSVWQEEIDRSIHDQYNVSYPTPEIEALVHDIDMAVLNAESTLFGPPGILAYLTEKTVEQSQLYPIALECVTKVMAETV